MPIDVELLKCVLTYAKKHNIELNETDREMPMGMQDMEEHSSWSWRSLLKIVYYDGNLEHVLLVLEYMEDTGIDYDINAEIDDGMSALDMANHSKRLQMMITMYRMPYIINPASPRFNPFWCKLIQARMIHDELKELLLIILQAEKERQTIASRGRTLLQYARRYGTAKHVSSTLESLKKCGIEIDIKMD